MVSVQVRERSNRTLLRTTLIAVALLVGAALLGFELGRRAWQADPAPFPSTAPDGSAVPVQRTIAPAERAADPNLLAEPAPRSSTLEVGTGVFGYAEHDGPILGEAGPVRRFRVAVEEGTGERADRFAAAVDEVLGDRRSWVGGRQLRLQRVPADADAEFTVYLASPATSEAMCAEAGLRTRRYSSCRTPGRVIINAARWWSAVPNYGAQLAVYRAYVVNHEVGHELGHGHVPCPGPGRPAPVMQQQTLALDGCVANAWPYP